MALYLTNLVSQPFNSNDLDLDLDPHLNIDIYLELDLQATETAFNMLVFRGIVPKIPNGEVLLFALGSAIYALLFK